MEVHDFTGTHKIDHLEAFDRLLRTHSHNQTNEFLLSHDEQDYPLLVIFVKDGIAALYFIPGDGEAGWASIGTTDLDPKKDTIFATGDMSTEIGVSNRAVVPLRTAVAAAKDFFHSAELPRSVEWLKL
jgi:Immunity protein Imm1